MLHYTRYLLLGPKKSFRLSTQVRFFSDDAASNFFLKQQEVN